MALTAEQIEKLASRKGVKRIPVENFLGSLDGSNFLDALANLNMDSRLYGWNAATIKALQDGITLTFKGVR